MTVRNSTNVNSDKTTKHEDSTTLDKSVSTGLRIYQSVRYSGIKKERPSGRVLFCIIDAHLYPFLWVSDLIRLLYTNSVDTESPTDDMMISSGISRSGCTPIVYSDCVIYVSQSDKFLIIVIISSLKTVSDYVYS